MLLLEIERIARRLVGLAAEFVDLLLQFDHAEFTAHHGAVELHQFLVAGAQFFDKAPDLLFGLLGLRDIPEAHHRQKRLPLRVADEGATDMPPDQVAPLVSKELSGP